MTEHRETVPDTRQLVIDDTVKMLLASGAYKFEEEEEAVSDVEGFVDRCIELGRYQQRMDDVRDTEARTRGYLLESLWTQVALLAQARRASIWSPVYYVGSIVLGSGVGLWLGPPDAWSILVVIGPILLFVFGALSVWQRAVAQRNLDASVAKLRSAYEYTSQLAGSGTMSPSRRVWLCERVEKAQLALSEVAK